MLKIIRILVLFLFTQTAFSQSYLKILRAPINGNYQTLAQFTNGDLLMADLSLSPFSDGSENELFMLRIDDCGDIVWSYSYEGKDIFHSLRDLIITEKDEIFLFGTAGIGGKAYIYFTKFNGNGQRLAYRRYDGATFDNLAFSVDYENERFIFSGVLLSDDSNAHSYVAIIDESLNLIRTKKYVENASFGETIFTNDGGALHQVKNHLIKLNQNGDPVWGRTFANFAATVPISRATETEGGFIFQISEDGFAYFIKIDFSGNLVWLSDKFPAFFRKPTMTLLPDGRVLVVYNVNLPGGTRPATLKISPDGIISEQNYLDIDYPLSTDFVHHALRSDGNLLLGGKAQQDFSDSLSNADFILRIDPDVPAECFFSVETADIFPNDIDFLLENFTVQALETVFTTETQAVFGTAALDIDLRQICGPESETEFVNTDTILPCRETWKPLLPAGFVWEAGTELFNENGEIDKPGSYRAAKRECLPTQVREYEVTVEECPCALYLPTAFSPNGDGINDCWRPEGFCETGDFEFRLYDRWGNLLHLDRDKNMCFTGEGLDTGVYIMVLQYTAIEATNGRTSRTQAQELTLIR